MCDNENFKIRENLWLNSPYNIRETWVLAYFSHLLFGALRNNFFNFFVNKHISLVELRMRLQNALEVKWHKFEKLQSKNKLHTPSTKTLLPIEAHASKAYTFVVYYDFQIEILFSCNECGLKTCLLENQEKTFEIIYFKKNKFYTEVYDDTM